MGGNAVANAVRLKNPEFLRIKKRILHQLQTEFGSRFFIASAESYRKKETHGDIDFVMSPWAEYVQPHIFKMELTNEFDLDIGSVVSNVAKDNMSAIFSLPYYIDKDTAFQVDIIHMSNVTEAMFAVDYFSYNDLGNLMGVAAHEQGFKFGHKGLHYNLYAGPTELITKVEVSTNFEDVIEFLGFNYDRWLEGFDTLEDIFDFVIEGKYVVTNSYRTENRPSEARKRDTHRPTYQAFLDYARRHPREANVSKDERLQKAIEFFPGFGSRCRDAVEEYESNKKAKSLFGAEKVTALTGLTGKPLGLFMEYIVYNTSVKAAAEENNEKLVDLIITNSFKKLQTITGAS